METITERLTTGDPLNAEELLELLPALKEVPKTLIQKYAVGAAVRRRFRAGELVCEEGEFGSTAFYIVSGHVDIYINNPMAHVGKSAGRGLFGFIKRMKSRLALRERDPAAALKEGFIPIDASVDLPKTMPLAWLGPEEIIGEMTCRTFQPRSATVRATEDCVVVEMLRVILDMLVGTRDVDAATKASTKVKAPTFKGTSFKKVMDDKYRERSLVTHLRSVPLFATLDLEFFNYLKEKAELKSFNKGEVICKQGEDADAFYLIRNGLVRVAQSLPGGEMVRTYLKRGEYFGEIGLLQNQARNATCSALDAADVVKIGKSDFQIMLEKFPVVRATLDEVARVRLEAVKERKLPQGLQLDEFLNQGLFEAQNLLLIDLDNCTRCDACVNACADAHDGVTRLIRDGLRYDRFLVATACRSCRDPLCMTQCPVGSIRRKESLEILIEDWCIGCSKCAELCPYGNINMHSLEVVRQENPAPAAVPAPSVPAKPLPQPPASLEATQVANPAAAPGAATVLKEPPKNAPVSAAVAKPAAPKKTGPKKVTVLKATTCDLCTQLTTPSCVYACPHDAAKRVEPTQFLATQIGTGGSIEKRRFNWLSRPSNRTTH
jgi:CRP-like cAMP-binding protein/Fe-S-cluster-containing hydrogenase component 2